MSDRDLVDEPRFPQQQQVPGEAAASASAPSSPAMAERAGVTRASGARVEEDIWRGGKARRRNLLHEWDDGGGEPCFVPDDDGGGDGGVSSGRHRSSISPSDLDYYRVLHDYLRSNGYPASMSSRVGSVEAVRPGSLPPDSPLPGGPSGEVALLTVSSLLAFSVVTLGEDGEATVLVPRGLDGKQVYGDISGFLMGIHHFNNGNGTVVKEIAGINETCPVRFVADFYDSESVQTTAIDVFSRQIMQDTDRPPSFLLGAWRSAVSVPLAILSGVYSIPQISPLSTSTELDDVTQYRYFSRLIPSDGGTARATVEFFRSRRPDLRHMGVIYVNDAYGSAFHQAIQESAQAVMPESERILVKGSPFSYNKAILNTEEIDLAVKTLADTGYRVFFGVFYDEHYPLIMESAVKFGIAGPGYVWVISDGLSVTYLQGRKFPAGSPLAVASQGIGILKAEGGREVPGGDKGYDRFARAWYDQTEEMERYYNCVGHPKTNSDGTPDIYYQADPGFFRRRTLAPTAGSVFTYDTVMAMGLAACGLVEDGEDGGNNNGVDEGGGEGSTNDGSAAGGANGTQTPPGRDYFTGDELFRAFVRQKFEGASGHIEVDPATTSRDPSSAFFVLYNAVGSTDGDGVTTFEIDTVSHTTRGETTETVGDDASGASADAGAEAAAPAATEEGGGEASETQADGGGIDGDAGAAAEGATSQAPPPAPPPAPIVWVDMPGKAYVYSDGTTTFPPPLPPVENFETNQLSPGIRGAGLALAGLVFATAVFFSLWTHHYRSVKVVKASQPMFLQMVCAGALLMGATIVTLSVDDGTASQAGCDAACMLSPWLFSYGFVISFSALFSKTWRINKIFHNPNCRRIKVTTADVMAPFVILFSLNTIILSVWTGVSPLTWQRSFLEGRDKFGRPVESLGSCRGELVEWVPYVICILVVNLSVLVLANVQAYQARTITTEYSESRYIAVIMMSLLQACFIGIPLMALVAEEPAANFFVRAGIIFVTCMSMLLLMFVPKMMYLSQWKNESKKKKAMREERERKREVAMERAAAAGYDPNTLRSTFGAPTSSIRLSSVDAIKRRVSDLEMGDPVAGSDIDPNSSHGKFGNGDADDGLIETSEKVNNNNRYDESEGNRENGDGGTDGFSDEPARKARVKSPFKRKVCREDDDISSDSSDSIDASSLASSIGDASGIRIMNHPRAESRQLLIMKAQIRHLKTEKLQLYERLSQLKEKLHEKDARSDEIEPLQEPRQPRLNDMDIMNDRRSRFKKMGTSYVTMSESHRKLLLEVESENTQEKEEPPEPDLNDSSSSSIKARFAKTVSFKFQSIRNLATSGRSQSSSTVKGGESNGNLGAIRESEEHSKTGSDDGHKECARDDGPEAAVSQIRVLAPERTLQL